MTKIYYDNKEMTKADRDGQIKEKTDRIREVARQEAREGITISDENDLTFFKR